MLALEHVVSLQPWPGACLPWLACHVYAHFNNVLVQNVYTLR